MAYADNIDVNSPADGDLLSLGDDAIRKLARALSQRLGALLVDPDADPPKLQQGTLSDAMVDTAAIQDTAVTLAKLGADVPKTVVKFATGVATGVVASGAVHTEVYTPAAAAGMDVGDLVVVSVDNSNNAHKLVVSAFVSGPSQITVSFFNSTGASITFSTGVYLIMVKAT